MVVAAPAPPPAGTRPDDTAISQQHPLHLSLWFVFVFDGRSGCSLHVCVLAAPGSELLSGWITCAPCCAHFLHAPDPSLHKPVILLSDIQQPNMLLDADGHELLADVRMARMQEAETTNATQTAVAGTQGFIDPTYPTCMTTGR